MAYKQAVIRDNPVGYWELDQVLYTYSVFDSMYADYTSANSAYINYSQISSFTDLAASYNATASGINLVNPIVSGSIYASQILNGSLITVNNKYKAFAQDSIDRTFSFEFWLSFNNNMNGQNGIHDWNTNNYQTNSGLNDGSLTNINLFYIKNSSTVIGVVFYEKSTNTIRYRLYGAGSSYSEAFIVLNELDTQYHIYASYSRTGMNIIVNNIPGTPSSVVDTSLFASDLTTVTYTFDGSSLLSGESFLVSDLAFYDYLLDDTQIKNHMTWAFNDDKPIRSTLLSQGDMFLLEDSQSRYAYRDIFMGKGFDKSQDIYNLAIHDTGLVPKQLQDGSYYSFDATPLSYNSGTGVSWTGGKNGIDFIDFGSIITIPGTITLLINASTSSEYVLSIGGVDGASTLFVEKTSTAYLLKYNDASNGSSVSTLATVTTTPTSSDKLALSFTSSSISLNVNGISASANKTISFSRKSILTVGQSYHLGKDSASLKVNSSKYSYISINDEYRTSFPTSGTVNINSYSYTAYPWTAVLKYSSPMTSNLFIYQKGYCVFSIPLKALSGVVGSKVDWTSMNNCVVEYSLDNGTTWYVLPKRGSHIPGFNFAQSLKIIMLRATMISNYSALNYNQSFNELEISFYKDLNYYSEGENFILKPGSRDATNGGTYTTKTHSYQILSRPNNLGLLFSYDSVSSSIPGYAKISNLSSYSVQSIDFWIRSDSNLNSAKIFTGDSAVSGYPDLYTSATGYLTYNSGITALYVNGVLQTSGSFKMSTKEVYHISVVMNSYTGDIFLNGTSSSTGLAGSYGFININQYPLNSWDVTERYNLFISNVTSIAANDNVLNSLSNQLGIDSNENYVIPQLIGS